MSSSTYQRVILVTGSNTGIGLEIVRQLAKQGHIVYLSARNAKSGLEAQSQLKADGLDVKFVQLDVSDASSVSAAKDLVEKAEGRLDTLVNNAGVSGMATMAGALADPISAIQTTLDTNLLGLVTACQTFVPLLKLAPQGQACIVNVASDMSSNTHMASEPKGFLHSAVAYNTSKAAANAYSIALAKELEGVVKVNVVTPGFTTTKLNGFAPGGKTPAQGAEIIVPWALLGPEDNRTCLFWSGNGAWPW